MTPDRAEVAIVIVMTATAAILVGLIWLG